MVTLNDARRVIAAAEKQAEENGKEPNSSLAGERGVAYVAP